MSAKEFMTEAERTAGRALYQSIQDIGSINRTMRGAHGFSLVLDWPAYWALLVYMGNAVSFMRDAEERTPKFITVGTPERGLRVVWPHQPEYVEVWTPGGLCKVYEGEPRSTLQSWAPAEGQA